MVTNSDCNTGYHVHTQTGKQKQARKWNKCVLYTYVCDNDSSHCKSNMVERHSSREPACDTAWTTPSLPILPVSHNIPPLWRIRPASLTLRRRLSKAKSGGIDFRQAKIRQFCHLDYKSNNLAVWSFSLEILVQSPPISAFHERIRGGQKKRARSDRAAPWHIGI